MVRLVLNRIGGFYFVALAIILMGAFTTGCESTRTVWKPAVDFTGLGVHRIAVVSVEGHESADAARAMEHELVKIPNLQVITRSQVDQVLKELNLEQRRSFNPSEAKRLGQLLGVDAFIVGSVQSEGGFKTIYGLWGTTIWITAQIIETETGRLLASLQSHGTGQATAPLVAYKTAMSNSVTYLFWNEIKVPVAK